MSKRLIGAIAEKDGWLCIQKGPNCWYPLDGASGLADDFREAFGDPQDWDIGKLVYRVDGVLQMENDQQRETRETMENGK